MEPEPAAQTTRSGASLSPRTVVVRLLFLVGSLVCCVYLVDACISSQPLAFTPTSTGATVVVYSVLIAEQLAWAWLLGDATPPRVRWARWATYAHVVFFGGNAVHQQGETSLLMVVCILVMALISLVNAVCIGGRSFPGRLPSSQTGSHSGGSSHLSSPTSPGGGED